MKPLIVANWKANPVSLPNAKRLFELVGKGIRGIDNVETVICPPFVYISEMGRTKYQIRLGAQDCFWDGGAYTGEISAEILKNLEVEYVIIGHSERRRLGETEDMTAKKIKATLKSGLKPILCVTDSSQARGVKEKTILAFEPISAIGSGRPYSIEEAKKMREAMRHPFVLYGGSVDSQNAADYVKKAGFQGLLVGTASLIPGEFVKIVKRIGNLD